MPKFRIIMFVGFISLWASSAVAHSGHGTTDPSNLVHFLSEPVHLLFTFALIAGTVYSISTFVRGRRGTARFGAAVSDPEGPRR